MYEKHYFACNITSTKMMVTATVHLVLLFFSLPNLSEAAISSNNIRGDKLSPAETNFNGWRWQQGQ